MKLKYGLWVTAAEQHAMRALLGVCATLLARPPARPALTAGTRGVTVNGTSMVCSSKPGDSRARWQQG